MSENPGECAYQYCHKPQSEQVYYLCETHYQQAWDNVLSKSPALNMQSKKRKLVPGRKTELEPYVCSRGHYVDPANHTAQVRDRGTWTTCRACNRARLRMHRNSNKNPDAMNALADEIYQQILDQMEKEAA